MTTPLSDLLAARIPPNDLAAERAVLGGAMLDRTALAKLVETLRADDFYREAHRKIFVSIVALFDRSEPADVLTLKEELRRTGLLEEVGGVAYLAALMEEASTAVQVQAYATIVRDKALLRETIRVATQMIAESYAATEPVPDMLSSFERMLYHVTERRLMGSTVPVADLLRPMWETMEALAERGVTLTGIGSGFDLLDRLTSGWQPGDLIVLAARPSMGKTALALRWAVTAGLGHCQADPTPKRTLILSLEMSKEQIMQRIVCAEARVGLYQVRTGYLQPSDWTRLTLASERLASSQIFIDDSPNLTVLEARAKARRLKAERGLDLVIIDYLQLMKGTRPDSRQQEISEICRSLKAMGKELNVPVIALSQLSRAVEAREKKEPQLSDLRESGAIEQDADVVMFLYRPERYGFEVERGGESDVIIGKQRNGPTGRIQVTFLPEYASFERMSDRDEPIPAGEPDPLA